LAARRTGGGQRTRCSVGSATLREATGAGSGRRGASGPDAARRSRLGFRPGAGAGWRARH
jgi:hypothetical protein